MINILFFAVLVTICLQLFFKAHTLSEHTSILHRAVTTCTSVAEVYQSSPNGDEIIFSIYPNALFLEDSILIYFDENYIPCQKTADSFRVVLQKSNTDSVCISFFTPSDREAIYTLNVSSYAPATLYELIGGNEP